MADTVVLDLQLNDDPLKRVIDETKELNKQWKDFVDTQKQWTSGFDTVSKTLNKIKEQHEQAQSRGEDPITKTMEGAKKLAEMYEHGEKSMKQIVEHATSLAGMFKSGGALSGIMDIMKFMKMPMGMLGPLGLGVGAAATGAGIYFGAAAGYAGEQAEKYREGTGLGVGTNVKDRLNVRLGAITDPTKMLEGMERARISGSDEDIGLRRLFGQEKADKLKEEHGVSAEVEALKAVTEQLRGMEPRQQEELLKTYYGGIIGGGMPELNRALARSPQEWEEMQKAGKEDDVRLKKQTDYGKSSDDLMAAIGEMNTAIGEWKNAILGIGIGPLTTAIHVLTDILRLKNPLNVGPNPEEHGGSLQDAAPDQVPLTPEEMYKKQHPTATPAPNAPTLPSPTQPVGLPATTTIERSSTDGGPVTTTQTGPNQPDMAARDRRLAEKTLHSIDNNTVIAPEMRKKMHDDYLRLHPELAPPPDDHGSGPTAMPTLNEMTQSQINVTGAGHASWTPGPSYAAMGMGGDPAFGMWMKNWFQSETVATKDAASAARARDQEVTQLLNWLMIKGDKQEQVELQLKALIESVDRHLAMLDSPDKDKDGAGEFGGAPPGIRRRGSTAGGFGPGGGGGGGGGGDSSTSSQGGGAGGGAINAPSGAGLPDSAVGAQQGQRGGGGGGGGKFVPGTETTTYGAGTPKEITQLQGNTSWGDYGTRANNPGNMDFAEWEGAAGRFGYNDAHNGKRHYMAVFKTMQEGYRAAYKLMERNQKRYGQTVAGAMHGWAEADYTPAMAKAIGLSPDAPFDITKANPDQLVKLFQMQYAKEGRRGTHSPTEQQMREGIELARNPNAKGAGGGVAGGGGYDAVGAGAGNGGAGSSLTHDYSGVTLMGSKGAAETVGGGDAMQATVDFARNLQKNDPNFQSVSAFNDATHGEKGQGPDSPHRSGRAGDVITKDLAASQQFAMDEFKKAGLTASFRHDGDVWIEPASMSNSHLHYQFENKEAADKYEAYVQNMKMAKAAADSTKKDSVPQTAPTAAASSLKADPTPSAFALPDAPPAVAEMQKHVRPLMAKDEQKPREDKGLSGHGGRRDDGGAFGLRAFQDPSRLGHKIKIDSSIGSDIAVGALTLTG